MKSVNAVKLFCVLILLFTSCYPISVTRMKWRIRWDKDMQAGKEHYMTVKQEIKIDRPPNVILLLADDLENTRFRHTELRIF